MALKDPPPELQAAIDQAAALYQVPADLLAGIWRVESGSSFPNPYVNSSGYGGLFGTRHWNTSTQDQANYAASILRDLHDRYHSWTDALLHYSGGGYSSVPGQTTPGGGAAPTGPSPGYTPTALTASGGGPSLNPLQPLFSWWGKPANVWTVGLTLVAGVMVLAGFFVYMRPQTAIPQEAMA